MGRWTALTLLLLVGCAPEAAPDSMPAATFATVRDQVFEPACAGCHAGSSPAGDLVLGAGMDLDALLAQPANPVARESGWRLIVPGDPDGSFLVRKLDGPGLGEGAAMPSERQMLAEPWRELVEQWIADGAQP